MIKILTLTFFLLCGALVYCQSTSSGEGTSIGGIEQIHGLCFVAPPEPFSRDPMPDVKALNAEWIALVPYGYCRIGQTEIRYNVRNYQWWGERPEGARESAKLARQHGIKVMMKPQIYVPGSWTGEIDFESESDWELWEESYRKFLFEFVDIAEEEGVEMLCIGTELKKVAVKRKEFWKKLISDIKTKYTGRLTYAANWDNYQKISFWEDLDYIGINAYFPLAESSTPSLAELKQQWKPIVEEMAIFSKDERKQILFAEYGYLSVDACAHQPWSKDNLRSRNINELGQSNAIRALLEIFSEETFWKGGFLWKWFPNGEGHEGYKSKDYTVQGKIGQLTLAQLYR